VRIMISKKQKAIFNKITLGIIIVVLIVIAYYSFTEKTYNYKLELKDVDVFSDQNILNELQLIKDTNIIAIIIDKTEIDYSDAVSVLYNQIFGAQKKRIMFYYLSEPNSCIYSDSSNYAVSKTTITKCKSQLNEINYPKIYFMKDKGNKKTQIVIENNFFYLYPKDAETAYEDSRSFLKILYPNLEDIEKNISNFITNVSGKINQK